MVIKATVYRVIAQCLVPYNLISFILMATLWAYYHSYLTCKETGAPGGGPTGGRFEPRLRDSQDCVLCTHEGSRSERTVAPSRRVPCLACGRWPLASLVPFEGRTVGCASCRSVGGAGSSLQFKGHTIANPSFLP